VKLPATKNKSNGQQHSKLQAPLRLINKCSTFLGLKTHRIHSF